MAVAYFSPTLALDANNTPQRTAEAQVYAAGDTSFSSPLTVTDLNGIPFADNKLRAENFLFPAFLPPEGVSQVVVRSGEMLTPLTSVSVERQAAADAAALAAERAAEAGTAAGAAAAAREAAEAAAEAAEAVGTTNDTVIAGRINDTSSATRTALNTTIGEVAVPREEDRALVQFPIGADDTAGMQNWWNEVKAGKRDAYLRDNLYRVSNLTLDYAGDADVALGFVPPRIRGGSKRNTIIRQLAGSTGDVVTIAGKGTAASHTGKVTALDIGGFTVQGASTGRDGIVLRSMTDAKLTDFWIQGCGRHGIALDRQTFTVGVADEYMYGLEISNGKSLLNGGRGIACIGQHPIGPIELSSVYLESNTAGGLYANPSAFELNSCYIGGNGGPGVEVDWAPGSLNAFSFLMKGGRVEGNTGYEIDIKGGHAHMLLNVLILATTGAHCVRVGGGTATANDFMLLGGMLSGDKATVGQKAVIVGPNSTGAYIHPSRYEVAEFQDYVNDITDIITDNGVGTRLNHRQYQRTTQGVMVSSASSNRSFESWQKGDANRRWSVRGDGYMQWGGGSSVPDVDLYRDNLNRLAMGTGDSFKVDGVWNGGRFFMGTRQFWIDASGNLRGKNGNPSSDTDGVNIAALP
ncbi:hypothetical protein [Microbacterium aurantiacum]|uniref:hypothetical protein n=1 Tax=Microbacterium aurantiacum TaxID=162393 RepID=UPI0034424E88